MNRFEFLEKVWVPYPAAENDWVDVAEFCRRGKPSATVVAGRLIIASQNEFATVIYSLASGGDEIVLQFRSAPEWLEPQASKLLEPQASKLLEPQASKFSEPQAKAASGISLDLLEDGDLIAIEGKKELSGSFLVSKILLLAPSNRSIKIPASEFTVQRGQLWSQFLSEVRGHFLSSGFLEALTPTLVPSPGTEPFLDPFRTLWEIGSESREFFLPTSPEFHLKQLLVRGWTKIFEIKPCFRNGEISSHHQPEFSMLEWYRAYANLDAIADDVESLLVRLGKTFGIEIPKLRRMTIAQLFAAAFPGFELKPDSTRDDLAALAKNVGVEYASSDSFDDLFFRLFLEKIETNLGGDGPVLVSQYPPSQAALSRIGAHGFAERFEVYWKGLELANAFHELNDPKENEARFKEDARKKQELGKPSVPRDENLVRAFHYGMPPSGGIALGVDRLFMALFEIEKIADARAFPIRHHESV